MRSHRREHKKPKKPMRSRQTRGATAVLVDGEQWWYQKRHWEGIVKIWRGNAGAGRPASASFLSVMLCDPSVIGRFTKAPGGKSERGMVCPESIVNFIRHRLRPADPLSSVELLWLPCFDEAMDALRVLQGQVSMNSLHRGMRYARLCRCGTLVIPCDYEDIGPHICGTHSGGYINAGNFVEMACRALCG